MECLEFYIYGSFGFKKKYKYLFMKWDEINEEFRIKKKKIYNMVWHLTDEIPTATNMYKIIRMNDSFCHHGYWHHNRLNIYPTIIYHKSQEDKRVNPVILKYVSKYNEYESLFYPSYRTYQVKEDYRLIGIKWEFEKDLEPLIAMRPVKYNAMRLSETAFKLEKYITLKQACDSNFMLPACNYEHFIWNMDILVKFPKNVQEKIIDYVGDLRYNVQQIIFRNKVLHLIKQMCIDKHVKLMKANKFYPPLIQNLLWIDDEIDEQINKIKPNKNKYYHKLYKPHSSKFYTNLMLKYDDKFKDDNEEDEHLFDYSYFEFQD